MAAIVGTAVANVDLVKNTAEELTFTVPVNDDATTAGSETFYITPAKRDGEGVIFINNNCGSTVSCTVLGGDFWNNSADMTAFEVATAKIYALTIDTGKYLQNTGKIHVKITPTTTTALTASNDCTITWLEL